MSKDEQKDYRKIIILKNQLLLFNLIRRLTKMRPIFFIGIAENMLIASL